jgi:hypothetical protein
MIHKRHVVQILSFLTLACGWAHAATQATANYSRTEVQKMIREARSAEQYRQLAEFYKSKQQEFEERARAEEHEWARRVFEFSLPGKYPRPEDSSRYRYEYLSYEAVKMSSLAAHYFELAADPDR